MTRTYRCPDDHPHNATCYTHGCGCGRCRAANAEQQRRRRRRIDAGIISASIDSAPTAERIAQLRADGWTIVDIATASGVSAPTISAIVNGRRPRVSHDVAEMLAYPLRRPTPPTARTLVDATGTRRRLQALTAHGWMIVDLAKILGREKGNLRKQYHLELCERQTRDAITTLYERLWDKPAPAAGRNRARALAARHGWVDALAWDDIDDPAETPVTAPPIDTAASVGAAAWRLDEAERFRQLGEPVDLTLRTLGTNREAFARLARNHHRPDLARWAERTDDRELAA